MVIGSLLRTGQRSPSKWPFMASKWESQSTSRSRDDSPGRIYIYIHIVNTSKTCTLVFRGFFPWMLLCIARLHLHSSTGVAKELVIDGRSYSRTGRGEWVFMPPFFSLPSPLLLQCETHGFLLVAARPVRRWQCYNCDLETWDLRRCFGHHKLDSCKGNGCKGP